MIFNLIIAWEASPDHMFFKYRSVTFLPLIVIYVAAISLTLLKKLRATVLFSLILIIVYACLISNTIAYLIIYSFIAGALSAYWSYPRPESSALLFLLPAAPIYSVICHYIAQNIHARQNY
jgi:glucan phosphoethanolaminetransferase (alkaline phosphatase superfamily)